MFDDLSALELAARIRRREISSVELTQNSLRVIRERNPELAAFIDVAEGRALRQARRADALAKAGSTLPFLGVPTGIKDHEHLRGHFTRVGSRALRFVYSPFDGLVAQLCRRAGFVMLGKLSCSELTILPIVDVAFHPPTRNPIDPTRYSGGSSGGTAAAVASGMIPIGPGSDGGGSVRIPASFCGLVGFKGGRGALPNPYGAFDQVGISAIGPLARSVRDGAGLMDALAGGSKFTEACAATLPPLRIKLVRSSPLVPVDPEIDAAVVATAKKLESLGHVIVDGAPLQAEIDEFLPLMARMVARVPNLPGTEGMLQPSTRWLRARGRGVTKEQAFAVLEQLTRRVLDWFGDVDVMLTPTVGQPSPKVGAFASLDGEGVFRAAAPLGAFTAPFNVSGQPAVSMPRGRTSAGFPIGVQLVGKLGEDAKLVSLAAALEASG